MISQNTINIVKSTAPILQQYGETLTKHFYKRMFTKNPEVVPFFNPANQIEGTQQRALSSAICAYAANIDNLDALVSAVELIAHKHASLMIKPEHYPIVGENLLASIKEVLGEGATDDIINGWSEAYNFLANILINREKQIYQNNAEQFGGWQGFRKFKVIKKVKESSNITSFYLKPDDDGELPNFQAGQYITVCFTMPNGSTTMRNYSLSDKPGQKYFRISVKREISPSIEIPDGYVSNKFHNEIDVNDLIEVGPPCGEFIIKTNEPHEGPLILLAAGIGITPILSIITTAIDFMPSREIILVHACLNESVQPFKNILDDFSLKNPKLKVYYRYSDPESQNINKENNCSTGFIDEDFLNQVIKNHNADYYFCGPKPFMVNIFHQLMKWGIPKDKVHFEFFGPKEDL